MRWSTTSQRQHGHRKLRSTRGRERSAIGVRPCFRFLILGGHRAGTHHFFPSNIDTTALKAVLVGFQDIDNVLSVVELSSTNSLERDGLGRATTVATTIRRLSSSVSLNQTFNAASNRTELRATVGSTPDFKNNYTYDKLRRLTDVVQTGQAGGNSVVSKHIVQSFNAASQRTNITRYQSAGTTNLVANTIFTYDTVGESAS